MTLFSAAVTAPAQVMEVSVEAPPAIDAGQAMTMDNVIPARLCTRYITCSHAPPLASASIQLLLTGTSAAAPLLVTGLPVVSIPFSGAPLAPAASYSAIESAGAPPAHTAPCRVPEHRITRHAVA